METSPPWSYPEKTHALRTWWSTIWSTQDREGEGFPPLSRSVEWTLVVFPSSPRRWERPLDFPTRHSLGPFRRDRAMRLPGIVVAGEMFWGSWWLNQPKLKNIMLGQIGSCSRSRDEHTKKYLKPPPRVFFFFGRKTANWLFLCWSWFGVWCSHWFRVWSHCISHFKTACFSGGIHKYDDNLYFGCRNRFFVLATKGSQREGPGGAHASVSDGGRWMGRVTCPGQSFQRMEAAPVGSTKHSLT